VKSEIYIEGTLGSYEEPIYSSSGRPAVSNEQVANVKVVVSYPKTGEYQNQYLFFSGICLMILLLILIREKTVD